MARLWTSGFELNSTTAAVEWSNVTSATIGTTNARSGTYCGTVTSATGTPKYFKYVFASSAATKNIYIRFYLYIGTLPNATTNIFSIYNSISEGAATPASTNTNVRLTSAGALGIFNSTTQIGSSSSALNTGQWYRVEVHFDSTAAGGSQTLELLLDGVSVASATNLTLSLTAVASLYFGSNLVSATTDTAGIIYFDDIALNDSSGTSQTTYPGSGKVIALRPNGDGDSHQWDVVTGGDGIAGTNNFARVNEVTPDDATTINGTSTTGLIDSYLMGDSGIGASDTVNVVQGNARFANSTADAVMNAKLEIKKTSGGTKSQSAAIIPNATTYATNSSTVPRNPLITLYKDPDGTNAWTQTTLDSMQAGYNMILKGTGSRRIDFTALWVYVDYTPAAIATLSVNVSDSITITESTDELRAGARNISVSDSLTITETITKELNSFISVSDTATITETKTLTLVNSVSVTDSPVITESQTLLETSFISSTDSMTITESTSLALTPLFISVSDSPTVTETVTKMVESYVSVSDTGTITESQTLLETSFINKTDTATITESVTLLDELNITKTDSVAITESTTQLIPTLLISATDTATITESILLQDQEGIAVLDTASITESVQLQITYSINVSDTATITESQTLLETSFVNATDTATITESTARLVTAFISVSDSATITETTSLLIPTLFISATDSTTISETFNVFIQVQGAVSVSETAAITETVTILIPTLFISVSESLTITEQTGQLLTSLVNASDTANITETAQILITGGILNINVSDSITVSETASLLIPQLIISASDLITLSESVSFNSAQPPYRLLNPAHNRLGPHQINNYRRRLGTKPIRGPR